MDEFAFVERLETESARYWPIEQDQKTKTRKGIYEESQAAIDSIEAFKLLITI